jgi:hypothetical protein
MSAAKKPVPPIISRLYPRDHALVGRHRHDASKALAEREPAVRVRTWARGCADPSVRSSIRRIPFAASSVSLAFSW